MPEELVEIDQQFRAASVAPKTIDEESRTVELTFSTGVQVKRFSWREGEFFEELAINDKSMRMDRLSNGAPLLDSHNAYSLDAAIGVVESAAIRNGKAVAMVRFAKDDERADKVWKKVSQGILRNVSVGYRIHEYVERKEGEKRIFRATDWEPFEISMVSVPADHKAQVRSETPSNTVCVVRTLDHDEENMATTEQTPADDGKRDEPEAVKPEVQETAPAAPVVEAQRSDAEISKLEEAAYMRGRSDAMEIVSTAVIGKQAPKDLLRFIDPKVTTDEARAMLLDAKSATRSIDGGSEINSASPLPDGDERSEVPVASIDTTALYKKRNAAMGSQI